MGFKVLPKTAKLFHHDGQKGIKLDKMWQAIRRMPGVCSARVKSSQSGPPLRSPQDASTSPVNLAGISDAFDPPRPIRLSPQRDLHSPSGSCNIEPSSAIEDALIESALIDDAPGTIAHDPPQTAGLTPKPAAPLSEMPQSLIKGIANYSGAGGIDEHFVIDAFREQLQALVQQVDQESVSGLPKVTREMSEAYEAFGEQLAFLQEIMGRSSGAEASLGPMGELVGDLGAAISGTAWLTSLAVTTLPIWPVPVAAVGLEGLGFAIAKALNGNKHSKVNKMLEDKGKVLVPFFTDRHAMYMEISQSKDGKRQLKIFNLGSGSGHHSENSSTRKIAHYTLDGVNNPKVPFNSSAQFQAITPSGVIHNTFDFAKTIAIKKGKITSDEQRRYLHVNQKGDTVRAMFGEAHARQKGGTCSYHSLMAVARESLPPDALQVFTMHMRSSAYEQAVRGSKESPSLADATVALDKLKETHGITDEDIKNHKSKLTWRQRIKNHIPGMVSKQTKATRATFAKAKALQVTTELPPKLEKKLATSMRKYRDLVANRGARTFRVLDSEKHSPAYFFKAFVTSHGNQGGFPAYRNQWQKELHLAQHALANHSENTAQTHMLSQLSDRLDTVLSAPAKKQQNAIAKVAKGIVSQLNKPTPEPVLIPVMHHDKDKKYNFSTLVELSKDSNNNLLIKAYQAQDVKGGATRVQVFNGKDLTQENISALLKTLVEPTDDEEVEARVASLREESMPVSTTELNPTHMSDHTSLDAFLLHNNDQQTVLSLKVAQGHQLLSATSGEIARLKEQAGDTHQHFLFDGEAQVLMNTFIQHLSQKQLALEDLQVQSDAGTLLPYEKTSSDIPDYLDGVKSRLTSGHLTSSNPQALRQQQVSELAMLSVELHPNTLKYAGLQRDSQEHSDATPSQEYLQQLSAIAESAPDIGKRFSLAAKVLAADSQPARIDAARDIMSSLKEGSPVLLPTLYCSDRQNSTWQSDLIVFKKQGNAVHAEIYKAGKNQQPTIHSVAINMDQWQESTIADLLSKSETKCEHALQQLGARSIPSEIPVPTHAQSTKNAVDVYLAKTLPANQYTALTEHRLRTALSATVRCHHSAKTQELKTDYASLIRTLHLNIESGSRSD